MINSFILQRPPLFSLSPRHLEVHLVHFITECLSLGKFIPSVCVFIRIPSVLPMVLSVHERLDLGASYILLILSPRASEFK